MFQPPSVSNFIPALCLCTMECSFLKGHHVRYILVSSHPHRASGFLLSKSRACVDACCRFQVHYANDSHKAKPCLLKRNLWPWQLWYSWTFLMVKCLWFYIIKTMQPWKYLLKCFKIYYNYWFMAGQNEKNTNSMKGSGECQLLWSCVLTSAVTFPNCTGFDSDAQGWVHLTSH